jgi:hypothetical protein
MWSSLKPLTLFHSWRKCFPDIEDDYQDFSSKYVNKLENTELVNFFKGFIYIYIYIYIYLTAIGLLPSGSVYKRTYIQQGNHTYISRHHTAQHK